MHGQDRRGRNGPLMERAVQARATAPDEPSSGGRDPARMLAPTLWPESEQTFKLDLGRLLDLLWARKGLFALIFSTISAAALLGILSFVPRYEARSSVIIAPEEPIVEVRSIIAPLSTESQAVTSEIEVVRSKPLVKEVIEKVGFREHVAAPPPPNRLESLLGLSFDDTFEVIGQWLAAALDLEVPPVSDLPEDKVLLVFYENLEVERVPNTSVLTIAFRATDPVLAADIVNQLAEEYVASQVASKQAARASATKLLTERLHQLRERRNESDQAVERFRTESGLIKTAGVELLAQQLSDQTTQLATVRAQQMTLEARWAELEALRAAGASDQLHELFLASPSIQLLRAERLRLQREIARQSKEYGPRHPVIDELAAELGEATARLDDQVNRAIEAVRAEVSMAAARKDEITEMISRLKGEIAELNAKEYKLRQLEGEAEINRSVYDAVVSRMREAEDVVFERADARVLSLADPPTLPAPSHGLIFLALAMVGAFGVSTGVALGLEFLHGGFRSEEELAGSLGLPVLGAVPRLSARGQRTARWPSPEPVRFGVQRGVPRPAH